MLVSVVGPLSASLLLARALYWSTISNAVEVTERQLPELHALFVEQAARLGMTPDGGDMAKTPRLYLGAHLSIEGSPGMLGLFAGKHMQQDLDLDAYYASVADRRDGFWLKLANFRADHPVGFRRMTTLRPMQRDGGDTHGRFF